MLDWHLFQSRNGWFFYVQNEKNVVWEKNWQLYKPTDDYVLTDYVLSESVKYVSQCDLILDQRVLCV